MDASQRLSFTSGMQLFAAGLLEFVRNRNKTGNHTASRPARGEKEPLLPGAKARQLLEWSALSTWRQQGSAHLQTGYRRVPGTLLGCLRSWTYIHNESVNIFSHVVGAIVFLSLPYLIFSTGIPPRLQVATTADILVCSIYLAGVALCFSFSTIFHTFMHLSERAYAFGIKLDYFGIILLMWGSTFPLVYYSFPCQTHMQGAYMTIITALAGLCSLATFHPSIGGPHLGHVRAVLFGSFGFGSFLVPIAHGVLSNGFARHSTRIGLVWIGLTVLCNGTGVVAYAFKFPEVCRPRQFDLFGASHQIMHIMVVFAALSYTKAMLVAFDDRHSHGITC